MHILILNGSPKGDNSITLQTARYWAKRNPQHQFETLHVGQRINGLSRDFTPAKTAIEKADLVVFAYPIYTFLAPYQLHRFVELMAENGADLAGKWVTQVTTSKHFYDVTAHAWLEANCYDFGGKYLPGLSADMEDLKEKRGQDQADAFFQKLCFDMERGYYKTKAPTVAPTRAPYEATLSPTPKTGDKDVVIVTNAAQDDTGLHAMMADFQAACPHPTRIVNIRDYPFRGGCLGCLACATTEKCVYVDGFDHFLRTQIQNADAMVYAFTVSQHYTHSSLKCYDDRQFCNGHRTVTHGMPVAYLIRGDYEKEQNLQFLVESRSQVGGLYLCGVATDEANTTAQISQLADTMDYALTHPIDQPANFYGVGGTKIFRDLVFQMQGLMQADHKFYKEHGIYDDLPHRNRGKILQMKILGKMMSLPSVQKKMKGQMSKFILEPYTKVVDSAQPIK